MDRRVGRHRVDEGDVIDVLRRMRKKIAHPLATLAVLLELPLRSDDTSLVFLTTAALRLHLDRLTVERIERRLVVERVDVAGAAIHEEEDHALGLRREMRGLGGERIHERSAAGSPYLPREKPLVQQAREREPRERPPSLPEEFTAGAPAELSVRLIMIGCHDVNPGR